MPTITAVWFGKLPEMKSITKVKGTTPTRGPHKRRVPPSNAMMTTKKDVIGLKAASGVM